MFKQAFVLLLFATGTQVVLAQSGNEGLCFQAMSMTTLPNNTFAQTGVSSQSATTTQYCGNQYAECFQSNFVPYITNPGFLVSSNSVCRVLLQYKTPAVPSVSGGDQNKTGVSEDGCTLPDPLNAGSPQAQNCDCQLLAIQETQPGNITFDFTMSQATCCPRCSCSGDPHCTAFNGAEDDWVVCNARNANGCAFNTTLCADSKYLVNGHPYDCRTMYDDKGNPGCVPLPNQPQPTMNMYSKIYIDPVTGTQYHMRVDLQLGNLGSIVCVFETYGPSNGSNDTTLTVCGPSFGGQSVPPGTHNAFIGQTQSAQFFARTRVLVTIQALNIGSIGEHLTVYVDEKDRNTFVPSGFCQSGVIVEKATSIPAVSACVPDEPFLFRVMCNSNVVIRTGNCAVRSKNKKQVSNAKIAFCKKFFKNSLTACETGDWKQYICEVVCGGPSNLPCITACEYQLETSPTEVMAKLGQVTLPPVNSNAPTIAPSPCPSALTPLIVSSGGTIPGKTVNNLPDPTAYIYVQKYNPATTSWGSPLMWLSEAEVMCNPSIHITNRATQLIEASSTYRILQCQQVTNLKCGAKIIDADVKTTWFSGFTSSISPSEAYQYSKQMRGLYNDGVLVCDPLLYPNCPPSYKCCIWGPDSPLGWSQCMQQYHPGFSNPLCVPQ